MKNIFANIPENILKKLHKKRQPSFVEPMLATLTSNYFSNNDWLYEYKFDGIRGIAVKKDGNVTLFSRNKRVINHEYPEIIFALEQQKADNFIVDGEIVAIGNEGIADFQSLQSRIHIKDLLKIKHHSNASPVSYCIFDIMYFDEYDLCKLPLLARKEILKKLFRYNSILIYVDYIIGNGISFFEKACATEWEGIVAKDITSTYVTKRSKKWLKFKCYMQQEMVIVGYTEPLGERTDFGALLVGYYEHGNLKYAGKVGTGYSQETLTMLGKKLRKLEIAESPFSDYKKPRIRVHWVKPVLVGEFQFAEWTDTNKLRVGRYKGLRNDKPAKKVVKEVPKRIGPK